MTSKGTGGSKHTLKVQPTPRKGYYTSVSEALKDAVPDTTITVAAGTYTEPDLHLNKSNIMLVSEGDGVPTLKAHYGTAAIVSVTMQIHGIHFETDDPLSPSLMVTGGRPRLFRCTVQSIHVDAEGAPSIENSIITGSPGSGLTIGGGGGGQYLHNTFKNHGLYAIVFDGTGSPHFFSNQISATQCGAVVISGKGTPTFKGNNINDTYGGPSEAVRSAVGELHQSKSGWDRAAVVVANGANPTLDSNTIFSGIGNAILVVSRGFHPQKLLHQDEQSPEGTSEPSPPHRSQARPSKGGRHSVYFHEGKAVRGGKDSLASSQGGGVAHLLRNTIRNNAGIGLSAHYPGIRVLSDGNIFEGNEGGVSLENGGVVQMRKDQFRSNKVFHVRCNDLMTHASLDSCDFSETSGCGLLMAFNSIVKCSSCVFDRNVTAVHLSQNCTLEMDESTITNNDTGIYVDTYGSAEVSRCVIENNAVGVLVKHHGRPQVRYGSFRRNHVAVLSTSGAEGAVVECSIVESNTAQIVLEEGGNTRFERNDVKDSSASAVLCRNSGRGYFEENVFKNHKAVTIRVESKADPMFVDNTIEQGTCEGVLIDKGGCGLFLKNLIRQFSTSGVTCKTHSEATFRANTITDNGFAGFDIQEGASGTYEKNEIRSNAGTNVQIGGGHNYTATVAKNDITASIVGVTLTDRARGLLYKNDIHGCQTGILLVKRSNSYVVSNHVYSCTRGIVTSDEGTMGYLVENVIAENTEHGMVIDNNSYPMLALNRVQGHTTPGWSAVVVRNGSWPRFMDNLMILNWVALEVLDATPTVIDTVFESNDCGIWFHLFSNRRELQAEAQAQLMVQQYSSTSSLFKPKRQQTEESVSSQQDGRPPLPTVQHCAFHANAVGLSVTAGGLATVFSSCFVENEKCGVFLDQGPDTHLTLDTSFFTQNGKHNVVCRGRSETRKQRKSNDPSTLSPTNTLITSSPSATLASTTGNYTTGGRRVDIDQNLIPTATVEVPEGLRESDYSPSIISRSLFTGVSSPVSFVEGCKSVLLSHCLLVTCSVELSNAAPWIVQNTICGSPKHYNSGKSSGTGRNAKKAGRGSVSIDAPGVPGEQAKPSKKGKKREGRNLYETIGTVSVWAFETPHGILCRGKAVGKIIDCTVSFVGEGIKLEKCATDVIGVHVYQTRTSGIYLAHGYTGSIDSCAAFCNYGAAIRVEGKMTPPALIKHTKAFSNYVYPIGIGTGFPLSSPGPQASGLGEEGSAPDSLGSAVSLDLPDISADVAFTGVELDTKSRRETHSSPKYTCPQTDGPGVGLLVEGSGVALVDNSSFFGNMLSNILCHSKGKSLICRSSIYGAEGYGVVVRPSCCMEVRECFLLDCTYAGALCELQSTPSFVQCTFHSNNIGVVCNGDSAQVARCIIAECKITGIRFADGSQGRAVHSEVSSCGSGIECRYNEKTAPTIEHCHIAQNQNAGILCTGNSQPNILFSTIKGHTTLAGILVRCGSKPKISRSVLSHNHFGVVSRLMAEPEVGECLFLHNEIGSVVDWGGKGVFHRNEFQESKEHAVMVRVGGDALFHRNLFLHEESILVTTEGRSTFQANTFQRPVGNCFLIVKGGAPKIKATKFSCLHHSQAYVLSMKTRLQPITPKSKLPPESVAQTPLESGDSDVAPFGGGAVSFGGLENQLSVLPPSLGKRHSSLRRRSVVIRPTADETRRRQSTLSESHRSSVVSSQDGDDTPHFASPHSPHENEEAEAEARVPIRVELGGRGTISHCLFAYNNAHCSILVDGTTSEPNISDCVFLGHELSSALLVSNKALPYLAQNIFLHNNLGILLSEADPTIVQCIFMENSTGVEGVNGSCAKITECEFREDNLGVNGTGGTCLCVSRCKFYSCDYGSYFESQTRPTFFDNLLINSKLAALTVETSLVLDKCAIFGGGNGVQVGYGGYVDFSNVEIQHVDGNGIYFGVVEASLPQADKGAGTVTATSSNSDEKADVIWGGNLRETTLGGCGCGVHVTGRKPQTELRRGVDEPNSNAGAGGGSDAQLPFTVAVLSEDSTRTQLMAQGEVRHKASAQRQSTTAEQLLSTITVTVKDCKFQYCQVGIHTNVFGRPLVETSKFDGCETGVFVEEDGLGSFRRCEVANCDIGIHTEGGVTHKDPVFAHCNVMDCTKAGVVLSGAAMGSISDCQMFDNTIGLKCRDSCQTLVEHSTISHPSSNLSKTNEAVRREGADVGVILASTTRVLYENSPAYNSMSSKLRRVEASKARTVFTQGQEKAMCQQLEEERQVTASVNQALSTYDIALDHFLYALPVSAEQSGGGRLESLVAVESLEVAPPTPPTLHLPLSPSTGALTPRQSSFSSLPETLTPKASSLMDMVHQLETAAGTKKRTGASLHGAESIFDTADELTEEITLPLGTESTEEVKEVGGSPEQPFAELKEPADQKSKKKPGLKGLVSKHQVGGTSKGTAMANVVKAAATERQKGKRKASQQVASTGKVVDRGPFGKGPIVLPEVVKVKKKGVRRPSRLVSLGGGQRRSSVGGRRSSFRVRRGSGQGSLLSVASAEVDEEAVRSSIISATTRRGDENGRARALAIVNTPSPPPSDELRLLPPLPPPKPEGPAYPRKKAEFPVYQGDVAIPTLPPCPPSKITLLCIQQPQHGKWRFGAEIHAQMMALARETNHLFADQVLQEFHRADVRCRESLAFTDLLRFVQQLCEEYRFHPGRHETLRQNALKSTPSVAFLDEAMQREPLSPLEVGPGVFRRRSVEGLVTTPEQGATRRHASVAFVEPPPEVAPQDPLFVPNVTSSTELDMFVRSFCKLVFLEHLHKDIETETMTFREFAEFIQLPNTQLSILFSVHFTWMGKEEPHPVTSRIRGDETAIRSEPKVTSSRPPRARRTSKYA